MRHSNTLPFYCGIDHWFRNHKCDFYVLQPPGAGHFEWDNGYFEDGLMEALFKWIPSQLPHRTLNRLALVPNAPHENHNYCICKNCLTVPAIDMTQKEADDLVQSWIQADLGFTSSLACEVASFQKWLDEFQHLTIHHGRPPPSVLRYRWLIYKKQLFWFEGLYGNSHPRRIDFLMAQTTVNDVWWLEQSMSIPIHAGDKFMMGYVNHYTSIENIPTANVLFDVYVKRSDWTIQLKRPHRNAQVRQKSILQSLSLPINTSINSDQFFK